MARRDSQRSKVYLAEQGTFGRNHYSPPELTVREAQKYTNKITSSGFYQAMGGPKIVICKGNSRRSTSSAVVSPTSFELAAGWGYSKDVILHELSHILLYSIDHRTMDHGPEFVLVFRRLIEQEFGQDVRAEYDRRAEKLGVRWGINGSQRLKNRFEEIR